MASPSTQQSEWAGGGGIAGGSAEQQQQQHDELSPLLISRSSSVGVSAEEGGVGVGDSTGGGGTGASVGDTVLNLMKTCMGTGCLALSYACRRGGATPFTAGMFAVAGWNAYGVQRLCSCLRYVPPEQDDAVASSGDGEASPSSEVRAGENTNVAQKQGPQPNLPLPPSPSPAPRGTSTLGRVAWSAYGRRGLQLVDAMMVLLLVGIVTSYVSAASSFLADTPFSFSGGRDADGNSKRRPYFDATIVASIMAFLSIVEDMSHLAKASALGLSVLLVTLLVIAGYGVVGSGREEYGAALSSTTIPATNSIPTWPDSWDGASQCFGVIVFGYGVVPLTYNYRDSMSEPSKMVRATAVAMASVASLYVVIGISLLYLFPGLDGDVLHELPTAGVLPVLTRLAMVWVILMTGPLIIVPCGELLEGKFQLTSFWPRVAVRFAVCAVCVVIAVLVPGFVKVLSLVGSACVGTVSLVLPPLLHLKLSSSSVELSGQGSTAVETARKLPIRWSSQRTDRVLLTAGVVVTVISTFLSL